MSTGLEELFAEFGITDDSEVSRSCCGRRVRIGDSRRSITDRLCINRCCIEWVCDFCGGYDGGYGPVGCRCGEGRKGKGGPNPVPESRGYHRRIRSRRGKAWRNRNH